MHGGAQCGGDFPGGLFDVGIGQFPIFRPGRGTRLCAAADVWVFVGIYTGGLALWVFGLPIGSKVRVVDALCPQWAGNDSFDRCELSLGKLCAKVGRCEQDDVECGINDLFGRAVAGTVSGRLCRVRAGICDAKNDVLLAFVF
jgi:hypothetical protein